ncbi:uncharacterized protein LOC141909274 [Tubulanus polymorphus]|uniref:uncharacterized protein LOC141909274 n=1 Tax=Tubulanus polymorphus TaxID=672921 RepID=UPI003DA437C2
MADLPSERLTPDQPAFTNTGVDYFGPIEVKRGRVGQFISRCHIPLILTHALRRFKARRGSVKYIRSDNGTNFVAAKRELQVCIKKWNTDKIHETMLQQDVNWEMNPPAASHFGGVWERIIRSVRKIMYSLIKEQGLQLNDESLCTLFCEVESILNGRPISTVNNDVNDLEPLTPNHLLLLERGSTFPPVVFDENEKRRWRQIQYIADLFWKRWVSEYLPTLQERSKWVKNRRNVMVEDIVLVVDSCVRNSWKLGRVIGRREDKNGYVRSVTVKTNAVILCHRTNETDIRIYTD